MILVVHQNLLVLVNNRHVFGRFKTAKLLLNAFIYVVELGCLASYHSQFVVPLCLDVLVSRLCLVHLFFLIDLVFDSLSDGLELVFVNLQDHFLGSRNNGLLLLDVNGVVNFINFI